MAMASHGRVRIGISGWTYSPWRGVFYPAWLPQHRELAYAASRFPAIEINGTFYGLQHPDSYARWHDDTPDDFVFAVKGSRYITHMRRLRDVETPLANFFASGLLRLGSKLGPILWQLPPTQSFDAERLEAFLTLLPHDSTSAAWRASRHDQRLTGRARVDAAHDGPVRHAIEIRHESFRTPAFIDMLRRHDVALVCADTVAWPLLMDLTSDFVYCRLHGSEELYVSGYDDEALAVWAGRVRAWAAGREPADAVRVTQATPSRAGGRDVFVFFDNDVKVRAPVDAGALIRKVSSRAPSRIAAANRRGTGPGRASG